MKTRTCFIAILLLTTGWPGLGGRVLASDPTGEEEIVRLVADMDSGRVLDLARGRASAQIFGAGDVEADGEGAVFRGRVEGETQGGGFRYGVDFPGTNIEVQGESCLDQTNSVSYLVSLFHPESGVLVSAWVEPDRPDTVTVGVRGLDGRWSYMSTEPGVIESGGWFAWKLRLEGRDVSLQIDDKTPIRNTEMLPAEFFQQGFAALSVGLFSDDPQSQPMLVGASKGILIKTWP